MKKKVVSILFGIIMIISLSGCGTVKLEDKTELADYNKMKSKEFNAKFTYLKQVNSDGTLSSDLYPNNEAMRVYEKGSGNGYIIVVTDCDKGSEIKSRMGSVIGRDVININNAEVVPETLGEQLIGPTLLVKQSDIEKVEETKLEDILKSNKQYTDIPDIFGFCMEIKDGKLNYDKKYSQRVTELLKGYENESAELSAKIEAQEKLDENIPKNVTSEYKAIHGKLLEAIKLGKTLTVKFKIEPSLTNKLTIEQNGFNVEDLILNQGADQFDTISYWAIADMKSGSEGKVISFTLDKDLIQSIKNRKLIGHKVVDAAKNVWLLPSLKN